MCRSNLVPKITILTEESIDIDDLDDSGIAADTDLLQSIGTSHIEDSNISEIWNYIENFALPEDKQSQCNRS